MLLLLSRDAGLDASTSISDSEGDDHGPPPISRSISTVTSDIADMPPRLTGRATNDAASLPRLIGRPISLPRLIGRCACRAFKLYSVALPPELPGRGALALYEGSLGGGGGGG